MRFIEDVSSKHEASVEAIADRFRPAADVTPRHRFAWFSDGLFSLRSSRACLASAKRPSNESLEPQPSLARTVVSLSPNTRHCISLVEADDIALFRVDYAGEVNSR